MEQKIIKCAIYTRKSCEDGLEQEFNSLDAQRVSAENYIASQMHENWRLISKHYDDGGYSGGNMNRPALKELFEDIKAGLIDVVVVYKIDRLSRSLFDFSKIVALFEEHNVSFVSVTQAFNTSTSAGKLMLNILLSFAQFERETIAERIRDNMHELAKTGRWLGGTTPTGYESVSVSTVTVDGKTRKACKLKEIPDEINLVKLIYDKFLETGSLTKTDQFLLEGGYQTKRGKQFTRFAIKGILTNPVYMMADEDAYQYLVENNVYLFSEKEEFDNKHGIMAYNRTLQRPGKATQEKPMNEWIVSVGKHSGIIPGATWVRIQKMLELNKSKGYRKPRSHVALLSGILRCGNCSDYMRPKMTNRLTATGEPIYNYLCTTKERSRSHRCNMKNANGNMLDKKVIAEIKKLHRDSKSMVKLITQAKRKITEDKEGYEIEITKVNDQIVANEKSIKKLVEALTTAEHTAATQYIVQQIDELHEKGERLKRRLSELESLIAEQELTDTEFDLMCQTLSNVEESIDQYTVEQKRAVIKTLVRKIVWDGENAHLYLFNSNGDYDFPSPPTGGDGPDGKPGGGGKSNRNPDENSEPLGEDSK